MSEYFCKLRFEVNLQKVLNLNFIETFIYDKVIKLSFDEFGIYEYKNSWKMRKAQKVNVNISKDLILQ